MADRWHVASDDRMIVERCGRKLLCPVLRYCASVRLREPRICTQNVGRNSLFGTRFEQGTHRITEVLTA